MPLIIVELLGFFHNKISFNVALIYGALLSIGIFIACVSHHPYFHNAIMYGMKLRIALAGLVYREVSIINFNIVLSPKFSFKNFINFNRHSN